VLYTALIIFEQRHVAHHMAEMRRPQLTVVPAQPAEPAEREAATSAVAA
jgi:hypothetical protein